MQGRERCDGSLPADGLACPAEADGKVDWVTDGMQDGERDVLDDALFVPVVTEMDVAYASDPRMAWSQARHLLRKCECTRVWELRDELLSPMSVVSSCQGAMGLATRVAGLLGDGMAGVRRMASEASSLAARRAEAVAGELRRHVPDDDWGDDYGSFEEGLRDLRAAIDGASVRMTWQDEFSFTRLGIDERGRLVDFLDEEVPEARLLPQAAPFWGATRDLHMLMFLQDSLRSVLSELSEYGSEGEGVHVADLSGALAGVASAMGDALMGLAGKAIPVPASAWDEIGRSWGESGDLVRKVLACEPSLFGGVEAGSAVIPGDAAWEEACRVRDGKLREWDSRGERLDGRPDEDVEFDLWGNPVRVPPEMRDLPLGLAGFDRRWADALAEAGIRRLGDLAGLGIEQVAEVGGVGFGPVEGLRRKLASLGLAADDAGSDGDLVQSIDEVLETLGVTADGREVPSGIDDIDLDALI